MKPKHFPKTTDANRVGSRELVRQLDAAPRENAELVKDKETLTCALEYARTDLEQARTSIAALTIGTRMVHLATGELKQWLDRRPASLPNVKGEPRATSAREVLR